jgi:hypothetical protein
MSFNSPRCSRLSENVPGAIKKTEAIEFLNGPNFISAESKPAELEFTSKTKRGLPPFFL